MTGITNVAKTGTSKRQCGWISILYQLLLIFASPTSFIPGDHPFGYCPGADITKTRTLRDGEHIFKLMHTPARQAKQLHSRTMS